MRFWENEIIPHSTFLIPNYFVSLQPNLNRMPE